MKEARVGLSRLLRSISSGWRAFKFNHAFGYTFLVSFSSADCCERGRCVPAIFGVRVAPAHDEPRSGSNNSERESTSGRSTDCGSGHLIRVFRDIGRIFSLLFLLSHPSPVGHPLKRRVQKQKTEYGFVEGKKRFQLCFVRNSRGRACSVSFAKTRTPPRHCGGSRGGVSRTLTTRFFIRLR